MSKGYKVALIMFLSIFLFNSCNKDNTNKIKFIKIFNYKSNIKYDTLELDKLLKHTQEDSLIATKEFYIGKNKHTIRMFCNERILVDCDGGIHFYELDSLGIIFSRSITWYSYDRIKCTNDSINNIIQFAIDRIIVDRDLSTYYHGIKTPNDNLINETFFQKKHKKKLTEIEFYKSFLDNIKFESYVVKTKPNYIKGKLEIDYFKSLTVEIKENILEQYNDSSTPNFAGKYLIISWSCGSPCQENAIIDFETGKVVHTITSSIGIDFKKNSKLIIINPPSNEIYNKNYRAIIGEPSYFVFQN